MKAIVIYDTQFGNTEQIAKTLASGMNEQGIAVDCVKVDNIQLDTLTGYDLLAIGGPTHGNRWILRIRKPLHSIQRIVHDSGGVQLKG
jgi:flavodoxin